MGSLLALAILCFVAMLGITRCKYGPDKVTGLDRNKRSSPTDRCIHDCAEAFEDSVKAENKLHKKNLDECRGGHGDGDDDDDATAGDPAGTLHDDDHHNDNPCVIAENARHKDALKRIANGLKDCVSGCHHQGAGSGH
jgi:hypothetical protein